MFQSTLIYPNGIRVWASGPSQPEDYAVSGECDSNTYFGYRKDRDRDQERDTVAIEFQTNSVLVTSTAHKSHIKSHSLNFITYLKSSPHWHTHYYVCAIID